jgi:hypothetical protein
MNHSSISAKCGRAFEKALTLFEEYVFRPQIGQEAPHSIYCAPGRSWGEVSTRACTF